MFLELYIIIYLGSQTAFSIVRYRYEKDKTSLLELATFGNGY